MRYLLCWLLCYSNVMVDAFTLGGIQSTNTRTRRVFTRNMFTGIVEEMGTVVSLEERVDMTLWDGTKGKGTEMTVKGDVVLDGAYLGYVTMSFSW